MKTFPKLTSQETKINHIVNVLKHWYKDHQTSPICLSTSFTLTSVPTICHRVREGKIIELSTWEQQTIRDGSTTITLRMYACVYGTCHLGNKK